MRNLKVLAVVGLGLLLLGGSAGLGVGVANFSSVGVNWAVVAGVFRPIPLISPPPAPPPPAVFSGWHKEVLPLNPPQGIINATGVCNPGVAGVTVDLWADGAPPTLLDRQQAGCGGNAFNVDLRAWCDVVGNVTGPAVVAAAGRPVPAPALAYIADGAARTPMTPAATPAVWDFDCSKAANVPTLTQWGLIALGLLLAATLAFMVRRRYAHRRAGA